MLLIGQYDSPYVRRVAVALKTYRLPYEHRLWSGFGDVDKIAEFNPMRRVPTLVLESGVVLTESWAIVEILDEMVGPARASLGRVGPGRADMLRLSAFAVGVADKGVSLVYERQLRESAFPLWVDRCRAQVIDTLDMLEAERASRSTTWLIDNHLSHADVVLGTMARFLMESLPDEFDWSRWPALEAHSDACEGLPAFHQAYQPFKLTMPVPASERRDLH